MKNNQMSQFFSEQENIQNLEQRVQESQFVQEIQQTAFYSLPNTNKTLVSDETTLEMKKKLTFASNFAVVGGIILILATIVRIVIDFLTLSEMDKITELLKQIAERNGEDASSFVQSQIEFKIAIIFGFIILFIAIIFTVLSFFVRKAKRKTIAINLIVFSAIFITLLLIGLFIVSINITQFNNLIMKLENSAVHTTGRDSMDAQEVVLNFKNIAGQALILIIVGIVSIVGWSCVLTGGILRVSIKDNKPVVKW